MVNAESAVSDGAEYVSGKYITPNVIEERKYQKQLVEKSVHSSTLIALPTGTGKTAVGVRIAAHRLAESEGRVMMLAPTQPLVNQHASFFKEALDIPEHEIQVFTGDIEPDERVNLWDSALSVVIATPQVIENDLIGNRYSLENVCHIIFDECHRATGDYAYTYIGERYHGNAKNKLATGLSASPGSSKDDILTICENLGLTNIEVLTEKDDVLKEYLHETNINYRWLDVPDELLEARDLVQGVYKDRLKKLKSMGVLSSARKDLSVKKLMNARGKIQRLIDNGKSKGYKAQSVHAEAMKLSHGWKIIETQSAEAALQYFEKIISEAESKDGSKAAQRMVTDNEVKKAIQILRDYDDVHPKMSELRVQVGRTLLENGKVLIFTESRETASKIVEFLDEGDIRPTRFVGQNNKKNDKGMSQTEQKETIEAFKDGEYNVLVSTSVGEEGIDIPAVDLVLFYEPVPNAIRAVQRRGRTGREAKGRVVILIAKDTRDETSYYISQRKEKKMKEEMERLKEMEDEIKTALTQKQGKLSDFGSRDTSADQPVVYMDNRETKSAVGQELDRMGNVMIKLDSLDIGDYVVSDRVAIERKELDDFTSSMIDNDRDIFDQIADLAESFERPVLIIEGGRGIDALYGRSGINEEAIRSTVQTIAVDFGVSLLFTQDEHETAKNVRSLARREQEENNQKVNPHTKKETDSMEDIQEYIVSSIPGVGPVTAEDLLREFKTIQSIANADTESLMSVDGVGEKTAERIYDIMTATY